MLGKVVITKCSGSFQLCPSMIQASLGLDIRTPFGLFEGLWEVPQPPLQAVSLYYYSGQRQV